MLPPAAACCAGRPCCATDSQAAAGDGVLQQKLLRHPQHSTAQHGSARCAVYSPVRLSTAETVQRSSAQPGCPAVQLAWCSSLAVSGLVSLECSVIVRCLGCTHTNEGAGSSTHPLWACCPGRPPAQAWQYKPTVRLWLCLLSLTFQVHADLCRHRSCSCYK